MSDSNEAELIYSDELIKARIFSILFYHDHIKIPQIFNLTLQDCNNDRERAKNILREMLSEMQSILNNSIDFKKAIEKQTKKSAKINTMDPQRMIFSCLSQQKNN